MNTRTIYLLLTTLILIGCGGKKQQEATENASPVSIHDINYSLEYIDPQIQGSYQTISSIKQDLNGDGVKDLVQLVSVNTDSKVIQNMNTSLEYYAIKYVVSTPTGYNSDVIYRVLLGEGDYLEDGLKDYQYTVKGMAATKNGFEIEFAEYFNLHYSYEERNQDEKDEIKYVFELNNERNIFQLTKISGIRASDKKKYSVDLKSNNELLFLTDDFNWRYPLLVLSNLNDNTEQKTKEVSNIKEFISAIANNTTIVLVVDSLDITPNDELEKLLEGHKHAFLEYHNLYLRNLKNFSIVSNIGTDVVVDNESINVLMVDSCENITLRNLKFSHTVPAGQCDGDVVSITESQKIDISDCHFNGSGVTGLILYNTKNLVCRNSSFYSNSGSGFECTDSENIVLYDCDFFDNTFIYTAISCYKSKVKFLNCSLYNNTLDNEAPLISLYIHDRDANLDDMYDPNYKPKFIPQVDFFNCSAYSNSVESDVTFSVSGPTRHFSYPSYAYGKPKKKFYENLMDDHDYLSFTLETIFPEDQKKELYRDYLIKEDVKEQDKD